MKNNEDVKVLGNDNSVDKVAKFGEKVDDNLKKVKSAENLKFDEISNTLPLEEYNREDDMFDLLSDVRNELEKATFNIEHDYKKLEESRESINFNKIHKEKLKAQLLNIHNSELMSKEPSETIIATVASILAAY